MTDLPLLVMLGLGLIAGIAGFVDSVAGGGGLLSLPCLLLVSIPPQLALGTNKLCSVLGTSTSVFNFAKKKKINWQLVFHGLVFMLLGGLIGSKCVLFLPQALVGKVVICLLPLGIASLFLKKKQDHVATPLTTKDKWIKLPLLCLSLGIYDGFFGPGVGSFLILGLFTLCHRGMIESTANAKVFNLASNLGAVIIFILNQKIIYTLGLLMAIFNMLGNYLGSHMAMKKGPDFIRLCLAGSFCLLLVVLAIKFL